MGAIMSQITSLMIVYSIVYSDADQRKHQRSMSLAFVRGIHRGPVNSSHKWPVTRKMFPFDGVIMIIYASFWLERSIAVVSQSEAILEYARYPTGFYPYNPGPAHLCSAHASIITGRILVGMITTLVWDSNLLTAIAHMWMWSTQMQQNLPLVQLGKSVLPWKNTICRYLTSYQA